MKIKGVAAKPPAICRGTKAAQFAGIGKFAETASVLKCLSFTK
jgi:hypothetical protein